MKCSILRYVHDYQITRKHLFTLTESVARPQAAAILQSPADLLVLERLYYITYTQRQKEIKQIPEDRTINKAIVVIALGQLSSWNGLPNFEDSDGKITGFELQSGELLGVQMNAIQLFGELGGGIAHISIWGTGTE